MSDQANNRPAPSASPAHTRRRAPATGRLAIVAAVLVLLPYPLIRGSVNRTIRRLRG